MITAAPRLFFHGSTQQKQIRNCIRFIVCILVLCCCVFTATARSIPQQSPGKSVALRTFDDTIPGLQIKQDQSGKKNSRLWLVAGSHAAIWGGTFVALNSAWYKGYPKSSFHFFDDRKEWNQIDKLGHIWTAYQLSRHSAETWRWAGADRRRSAWLGAGSAFAFQSIIEILDGFSEEWGFSVGDMEANLIGSGGYLAQELLFNSQIFQVKMGYKPYNYPPELKQRRNQLFGSTLPEQILKDYNSQRYWLGAGVSKIFSAAPPWLNIAIGFSSDGMYGGHGNTWTNAQGIVFDRSDIKRVRRFYLAPDIDLTKIKTGSNFLRSVFFILNMVKIPAPALEYNSRGKFRLHALMF